MIQISLIFFFINITFISILLFNMEDIFDIVFIINTNFFMTS